MSRCRQLAALGSAGPLIATHFGKCFKKRIAKTARCLVAAVGISGRGCGPGNQSRPLWHEPWGSLGEQLGGCRRQIARSCASRCRRHGLRCLVGRCLRRRRGRRRPCLAVKGCGQSRSQPLQGFAIERGCSPEIALPAGPIAAGSTWGLSLAPERRCGRRGRAPRLLGHRPLWAASWLFAWRSAFERRCRMRA